MSLDSEISTTAAVPITPSAAAQRMRDHRARRRRGHRCVTIELRETEIDLLIRRGLLKAEERHDRYAICNALYCHFEVRMPSGWRAVDDDHLRHDAALPQTSAGRGVTPQKAHSTSIAARSPCCSSSSKPGSNQSARVKDAARATIAKPATRNSVMRPAGRDHIVAVARQFGLTPSQVRKVPAPDKPRR
jgi:hypothetical protein